MTADRRRQRRDEELRRGRGAARRLVRPRSGARLSRAGRPQRRRQDDADQADARPDPRRPRHDPRARRGSGGRRVRGAPAARLSAGERRLQCRADRARDAGLLRAAEAIKPVDRRWPLLDRVGLGRMPPTAGSAPIPRACGSGSAWPRRCSDARGCCCWTSRPPGSIRRCARPSTRSSSELRDDGATVLLSSHALDRARGSRRDVSSS